MTEISPTTLPRADVVTHYVVSGRNHAPALVLLHPLAASLAIWDLQLAEFERFFRVIRIDLRGHDQSNFDDGSARSHALQDLALDALAVLDALRIERAHWCGLAIGGSTALQVAITAPRRVLRLVLVNTAYDADLSARLGEVRAPTLVIAGAHDPATPAEQAEALVDGISGADLVVLDAAHLPNVEQAEDLTRTVVNFLRD